MAEWTGGSELEADGNELELPLDLEPVVSAFLIGASQWRWIVIEDVPLRVGLDYGGLRHGCAMARLRLSAADFEGVRIMERHALKLLAR